MMSKRRSARAVAAPLTKTIIFVVVAVALMAFLAIQLGGNLEFRQTNSYSAEFTDTSGLRSTEGVRIAGVEIGAVTDVKVKDSKLGIVSFEIDKDRALPRNVRATIRYLNLTGDRYLELSPGPGDAPPLPPGSMIPQSQTKPALDLDVLLAGFNPLFEGLDPGKINELSGNIVSVLQGQGGTLDDIFAHAASLSTTLAGRDQQIDAVIGNLNAVLGTLDQHAPQLAETIKKLQELTSGLAKDREQLGGSLGSVDDLLTSTHDLLDKVRGPLKGTVDQLHRATDQANKGQAAIDEVLGLLPGGYLRISRLGSRGSTYNLFVCALRVKLTGPDGNPFYTPWQGPNPNIERCRPGNIYPLETPDQRIRGKGASDVINGRVAGQPPNGGPDQGSQQAGRGGGR